MENWIDIKEKLPAPYSEIYACSNTGASRKVCRTNYTHEGQMMEIEDQENGNHQ